MDESDLHPPRSSSPHLIASSAVPSASRARRLVVAGMDDRALVAAMRDGDVHAWAEFHARFRPPLAAFARRVQLVPGLNEADIVESLVDDLLGDESARLTGPNAPLVPVIVAYLLRAARNRLINLKRGASRRTRRHESASSDVGGDGFDAGEHVVTSLCSEYVLRVSAGPTMVREGVPNDDGAVQRLAAALRTTTTIEEQQLLGWVAQRVPYRTIAAWMHIGYDAAAKRIARLSRRLRGAAVRYVETAPPAERAELERFLRRAGALPPLVSAPAVRYHAVGTTVIPVDDHE